MLNGALVIEMVNNLLVKIRETLVVSQNEKRSNKKKMEARAVKNVFPIDSANSLFGRAILLMFKYRKGSSVYQL